MKSYIYLISKTLSKKKLSEAKRRQKRGFLLPFSTYLSTINVYLPDDLISPDLSVIVGFSPQYSTLAMSIEWYWSFKYPFL